jgi:hypothetical protein
MADKTSEGKQSVVIVFAVEPDEFMTGVIDFCKQMKRNLLLGTVL